MEKRALVIVFLLFITGSMTGIASAKEEPWTLADLEAAAREGSFVEALEHLGDVPPSKRTDAWKKTAEAIALGFMEYCAKQEDPLSALMMGEAILMHFPGVRKSRAVMDKRNQVGLKGFATCFGYEYAGDECTKVLTRFVDGDPGNAELAMGAGRLVRKHMNHYVATPFFQRAISWGKAKRATMCKDGDLSMAVVAGLALPPDYDQAKDARQIADACFGELKSAIVAELKPGASSYYVDNACPVLRAKKASHKACEAQARR